MREITIQLPDGYSELEEVSALVAAEDDERAYYGPERRREYA